ncbi:MAG TPA: hypothetical protein VF546_10175 [Pyrinomonadaceae bacterium]|jgi:hypothetical protein
MALLLALAALLSGALLTYLFDDDAPPSARLCAGASIGFAALGLCGYVLAALLGSTTLSLALTALLTAAPLLLLARADWRARILADARVGARSLGRALTAPTMRATLPVVLFVCALLVFWRVFDRAFYEQGGALFTGVENNLGDLPFHLAIITGFARGANFPPQHPEFAGARLTYPFLADFVAALFVRGGAALTSALFWENLALALALAGLLYRFALRLTRERSAALVSVALTLLSGGLGWLYFGREWLAGDRPLFELLMALPRKYTISYDNVYRWGNAVTTLLVPQRALLLGLPLALVVMLQWWRAVVTEDDAPDAVTDSEDRAGKKGKRGRGAAGRAAAARDRRAAKRQSATTADAAAKATTRQPTNASVRSATLSWPAAVFARGDARLRRMIGAGLVAGLLPLAHAHTFVVLMIVGACLALLFPRWRLWFAFFAAASALALPQMWWATRGSAVRAGSFFELAFGWDHGAQNVFWFWLNNTGLFIPLLAAALLWRGRAPVVPDRLLRFYLPFTLCFAAANVTKLSPYLWDNIKVLFCWYVASTPLVALLLVRVWRAGRDWRAGGPVGVWATRIVAAALFLSLTLAGALDVWRITSAREEQREFDSDGVAFAALVERATPPHSLILIAPTYNHPVFLSGRRALLGYGGHLWSQGIDYGAREQEVRRIYAGGADAPVLLTKYGVAYAVTGPLERAAGPVNEQFFARYPLIGEIGEYRLYKIAAP